MNGTTTLAARRIAVLGDLSGHLKPLLTTLAELGVEVEADLTRQEFAQTFRPLVVQTAPSHVEGLDLGRAGGSDRLIVALADGEVVLDEPPEGA